MLHVLQVTDCHLFAEPGTTLLGVCCHASLNAVLEAACEERAPDAVLATGDIAQRPVAATYRLFLDTLQLHCDAPLLCVPGNHDLGAVFSAELPTEDLALGRWRVAGVDTHVDGEVGGTVAARELARLRALPKGHTLVAGHHCPVHTGCAWLDEHRIVNGDALLAALDGASAYAFGHIHQPFERPAGLERRGPEPASQVSGPQGAGKMQDEAATGKRPRDELCSSLAPSSLDGPRHRLASTSPALFGTPSTCFQFAANTPTFAIDSAKPGYRWLHLADDGSVTTEVCRVEDFNLTIDLEDRDHR